MKAAPDSYSAVLISQKRQHLEVILNRPQKRNALNAQLITELKAVLRSAAQNQAVRTLTLRGAGSAFCSGADLNYLKEMRKFSREENLQDSLSLAQLYLQLYRFPKPVIAVVEGPALAGGCGLASVCDFILATPQARFGYPEVKIGFVAALVSAFLVRQIGERKAREFLLSGKIISAEEAKTLGLISQVLSADLLPEIHQKLLFDLSNNSAMAIKQTKEIFAGSIFPQIENELRTLAWINATFRETEDFIEGISAFVEKRRPSWYIK